MEGFSGRDDVTLLRENGATRPACAAASRAGGGGGPQRQVHATPAADGQYALFEVHDGNEWNSSNGNWGSPSSDARVPGSRKGAASTAEKGRSARWGMPSRDCARRGENQEGRPIMRRAVVAGKWWDGRRRQARLPRLAGHPCHAVPPCRTATCIGGGVGRIRLPEAVRHHRRMPCLASCP